MGLLLLKVMRSRMKNFLSRRMGACGRSDRGTRQMEMGTFDVAQARSVRVPRMPRTPINHGR